MGERGTSFEQWRVLNKKGGSVLTIRGLGWGDTYRSRLVEGNVF